MLIRLYYVTHDSFWRRQAPRSAHDNTFFFSYRSSYQLAISQLFGQCSKLVADDAASTMAAFASPHHLASRKELAEICLVALFIRRVGQVKFHFWSPATMLEQH